MGWVGFDLAHGKGNDYAHQAAKQEAARQAAITKGTKDIDAAYAGFNQDFYDTRSKAYTDYAMPQLAEQYRGAKSLIDFNLSNRGLQGSSAQKKQYSDLADQNTRATQGVVDAATNQQQQLRGAIEQSKDTELAFLNQSADPAGAAASATAEAASFRVPSTLPIIAGAFNSLLNQYYYSQLVNAYKPSSFVTVPPTYSGAAPIGSTQLSVGGNS